MKALLDTHTFLWWITDDPRLSSLVNQIISDGGNILYFSAASCWEIAIKARLGKLELPVTNITSFISDQLVINAITPLPVEMSHACTSIPFRTIIAILSTGFSLPRLR